MFSVLGRMTDLLGLFRGEGSQGKRMNFFTHAFTQSGINPLVLFDRGQTGKSSRDDQCFKMGTVVSLYFYQGIREFLLNK